jgi:hypothetical protein
VQLDNDLVDYRRSELRHVMLDVDTSTLDLLTSLTRTTPDPDFLLQDTVALGRTSAACNGSLFVRPLRANISETLPVVVINQQGEEEKNKDE